MSVLLKHLNGGHYNSPKNYVQAIESHDVGWMNQAMTDVLGFKALTWRKLILWMDLEKEMWKYRTTLVA